MVSFTYRVTDEAGTELEKSDEHEPMFYLHGHNNLLRGLEVALEGKAVSDEVKVTLSPQDAYGVRRDDAVQRVPIKHLVTKSKRYQPGMIVQVQTDQGARNVTVVKVGKFNVDVDFNHPYAGKTLTFDVSIQSIRDATEEELTHRHAHGPDGHHHH